MKSGNESLRIFIGLFCFFLLIGFSSCSMTFEKRHYRKGYHVSVVKNNPHRVIMPDNSNKELLTTGLPDQNSSSETEPAKKETSEDHDLLKTEPAITQVKSRNEEVKVSDHKLDEGGSDCDQIVLKDGTEMDVIIENIGETEVTYRKCNFEAGPSYTLSMSKVEVIHLRNGDHYRPKYVANTNSGNVKSGNGMGELVIGILAFAFSLFAFVMSFLISYGANTLAFIFGPIGLILGIIGVILSAVKMNADNMTKTVPGIILAGLAILLFMIAIAILVLY